MEIRKAKPTDIEAVVEIYRAARVFMRESGNPDQWSGSYPNREDVMRDIAVGGCHVCLEDEEIVGVFYFMPDADDPTYHRIYEGEWLSDEPYAVIHRIAVKYHGRGIGDFCFKACFKLFPNLRIDTHRDNLPMQRSLERAGFRYCGIIYLADGSERLAYQRL